MSFTEAFEKAAGVVQTVGKDLGSGIRNTLKSNVRGNPTSNKIRNFWSQPESEIAKSVVPNTKNTYKQNLANTYNEMNPVKKPILPNTPKDFPVK
jgi:hypothetical protein